MRRQSRRNTIIYTGPFAIMFTLRQLMNSIPLRIHIFNKPYVHMNDQLYCARKICLRLPYLLEENVLLSFCKALTLYVFYAIIDGWQVSIL